MKCSAGGEQCRSVSEEDGPPPPPLRLASLPHKCLSLVSRPFPRFFLDPPSSETRQGITFLVIKTKQTWLGKVGSSIGCWVLQASKAESSASRSTVTWGAAPQRKPQCRSRVPTSHTRSTGVSTLTISMGTMTTPTGETLTTWPACRSYNGEGRGQSSMKGR